jgi:hypothetical protein
MVLALDQPRQSESLCPTYIVHYQYVSLQDNEHQLGPYGKNCMSTCGGQDAVLDEMSTLSSISILSKIHHMRSFEQVNKL